MSRKNGLEVLKELRADHPRVPVVILSMHPKEQYASRALRTGASAYVTKERASEELISAVRRIFEIGIYTPEKS